LTEAPEQVIWALDITKGVFRKKIVNTLRITNYRVFLGSSYIGLSLLDDIVVMNQHRVSDSSYTSVGGSRGSPRVGSGRSRSKSVGDVAFIYQGAPYFTFIGIEDPQGVARLAKAARKTLIVNMKAQEKIDKVRLEEERRLEQLQQKQEERIMSKTIRTTTRTKTATITCRRCNTSNAEASKYCNNCGFRLDEDGGGKDVVTNEGISILNQKPSSTEAPTSPVSTTSKISQNLDQGARKQDIDNNGFLTCELPDYGIRINYPSNWIKVEEGLKAPMLIGFKSPMENPSDTVLENVVIGLNSIQNIITLEQFVQANINGLKANIHEFSLIESIPTRLAGHEAHKLVYNGNGKRFMFVVTIVRGKVYHIIFTAEPTKYDVYLPIVQKMFDSFQIMPISK